MLPSIQINDRTKSTWNFILAIAGGAFASLIAFAASPLSVELLGELKFAQLSLWIILITFVPVLDLGVAQNTIRQCSNANTVSEKAAIISRNNHLIILIICCFIPISALLPKPDSPVYATITDSEWLIFKSSIILNLKVGYNQSCFLARNKQFLLTKLNAIIAVLRYLFPILVYVVTEEFSAVTVYFLISTFVIIYLTDRKLGLHWRASLPISAATSNFRENLRPSLYLYMSAACALILSVLDRILVSYIFDIQNFAEYIATFTLASAVNIVVLPFYRFFIGGLRASNQIYNQKNALRMSAVQSYACLLTAGFLCLYGVELIRALGLAFPIDVGMLIIFTLSLWGAANGWIIAAELMLRNQPTLQARLIGVTICAYLAYLAWRPNPQSLDLAMVWIIHGVIQTFICPLWLSDKFRLTRYGNWLKHVVLKPSLVVCPIIISSFIVLPFSTVSSLIIFTLGALTIATILIRSGVIEKVG